MTEAELRAAIQEAMWNKDEAKLHELARCDCCCDEHFHEGCIANLWGGCRGADSLTKAEIQKWAEHYGMTLERFYGAEGDGT